MGIARYAETASERTEVLARHNTVLSELLFKLVEPDSGPPVALIVTSAWGDRAAWLYHPYDGGADVIARSSLERDGLAARYGSWLSDHPQGL